MVDSRRGVARGSAQVVSWGERRLLPKVAQHKLYLISFKTELKGPSGICWTLRIWELSGVLRVRSDSTPKTQFLNIAPEWAFLISYKSDVNNNSISRRTTLIHAELTELRMPQVTLPKSYVHTKSARMKGWLKTTIIPTCDLVNSIARTRTSRRPPCEVFSVGCTPECSVKNQTRSGWTLSPSMFVA